MALFLGTLKYLDQSGDEPECTFYIMSLQVINEGCTQAVVKVEHSKEMKILRADIPSVWSKARLLGY